MLPQDAAARKAIPVYSGFVKYFPRAMAAVAELSRVANDQHNPGQPLHWSKGKSTDHLDALMRHMLDKATGTKFDTDGQRHATKTAWRAMAELEIELEREESEGERAEVLLYPPIDEGHGKGSLCKWPYCFHTHCGHDGGPCSVGAVDNESPYRGAHV